MGCSSNFGLCQKLILTQSMSCMGWPKVPTDKHEVHTLVLHTNTSPRIITISITRKWQWGAHQILEFVKNSFHTIKCLVWDGLSHKLTNMNSKELF